MKLPLLLNLLLLAGCLTVRVERPAPAPLPEEPVPLAPAPGVDPTSDGLGWWVA